MADLTAPQTDALGATDEFDVSIIPMQLNSEYTDLVYELNRLAGTLDGERPLLAPDAAANAWASTTDLALLGALNAKNSTTDLGLRAVCNALGSTTDEDPAQALSNVEIPGPPE